jgi:hypothetical protein
MMVSPLWLAWIAWLVSQVNAYGSQTSDSSKL